MVSVTHNADSLHAAGDIIRNYRLILIVGDQISPVPLDNFALREKIYLKTGRLLPPKQVDSLLFTEYEKARLVTSNILPHYNYLCLLRLIKRNIVNAIITTNFDNYLNSALFRYGSPFKGVMNPCIPVSNGIAQKWCCDGYYSPVVSSACEVPIWKIHGDLGFVRMVDCSHIFALPKFIIERPRVNQNRPDDPGCCHFITLQADGSQFKYDPSLSREHYSFRYRHHIDFGASRDIFLPEMEAASEQLLQHCNQGGGVFIIGMKFNPDYGEDLTDILLDLPKETPIIYLVASKKRQIRTGDSELLDGLIEGRRSHILINEVTETGAIDEGLLRLMDEIGETGINEEYNLWIRRKRWWIKSTK